MNQVTQKQGVTGRADRIDLMSSPSLSIHAMTADVLGYVLQRQPEVDDVGRAQRTTIKPIETPVVSAEWTQFEPDPVEYWRVVSYEGKAIAMRKRRLSKYPLAQPFRPTKYVIVRASYSKSTPLETAGSSQRGTDPTEEISWPTTVAGSNRFISCHRCAESG